MGSKMFSLISLFSLCLFILTGCWDEVEIEERGFLSAVAIDLADEQGGNTTFELTEQFVVPAGLGTPTAAGGGKAYRNLSQTGESLFEINTNISRQANRKVNIEHLGLIIISAEIAEEDKLLANVLDVFVRQQFMRRGIVVAIANGKAKELLDIEPEHQKVPAQYINELLDNRQTPITTEPIRLGDIQEKLLMNRSYTIPQLSVYSDNSINYESVGVVQEPISRLMGTLKYGEAKGLHFIIGENQKGSVNTDVEGEQATFEIIEGTSQYRLTNRDKNELTFQVDIDITAEIMEYFGTVDFYKEENLKKFEQALESLVKTLAEATLTKLQDDMRVDVLKFDNYLRVHHNKLWEEIKADWDHRENYFSQSEITLNIKANITEPGTSVRVNSKGD